MSRFRWETTLVTFGQITPQSNCQPYGKTDLIFQVLVTYVNMSKHCHPALMLTMEERTWK